MHLHFTKKIMLCLIMLLVFCCEARADLSAAQAVALRMQTPVVDGKYSPDIAAIQKRGTLRWAIYKYNAPPFSMRDAKGNWSGIEIDFANMIAQQLGVTLTIIPSETYDGIVAMVANGQADIGSNISVSASRGLQVSFTEPYYTFHPHLLVNRLIAAKLGWTNAAAVVQGIQNSQMPIKIGVLEDSSAISIIHQVFPNAEEVAYNDPNQGMYDVLNGKIFAAAGLTPNQIQNFLNTNSQAALRGADITINQAVDLIALAVPWQDYHLREWLNVYFYYLSQNGFKQKIMQKYGAVSL